MGGRTTNRDYKTFHIYVTEEEHAKVVVAYRNTTCQSLSQYARTLILGKPVTVYYRNQSFDLFSENYMRFKRDLTMILGKDGFSASEKDWLLREIAEIKTIVNQIADQCLRK